MSSLETKSLSDTVITTVKPAVKEGKKIRWNILQAIFIVKEELAKSKLKPKLSKKTEKVLVRLNNYLSTETIETFLFCCIFSFFIDDDDFPDFCKLKKYFDMDSSQLILYKKYFDSLQDKKIITTKSRNSLLYYKTTNYFSSEYRIEDPVLQSIIENRIFSVTDELDGNSSEEKDVSSFISEACNEINAIYEQRFELKHHLSNVVITTILKMECDYSHLSFIQTMKKTLQNIENRIFFYLVCASSRSGSFSQWSLSEILVVIYTRSTRRFEVAQLFIDEKHTLLQQDLIQFEKKGSVQNTTFTLTDKGWDVFLGEHANLFKKKFDDSKLLKPDAIKEKSLFYSKKNEKEINHLQAVFEEKQFSLLQKRLAKESLPSGVAVLFYGAPGTGKTESVYQIAKKTGRAIFHVDISKTKTCWYGESEKLIKNIFSSYKTMCKIASQSKTEKMPILLFNEADAIFSKRSENPSRSTDKTDNAIQNIILEEMESLQGILIATTNLATNFDAAFERRFLFKIQFESPSTEAKKLIWKNKIQWISEELSHKLASEYLFSGGEIDNIARKISLHHIVTGKKPCKDEIIEFCQSEKILAANTEGKTVGF
ncbi:MAG: ATP-binding protein [Treponemataceae bacterium]